MKSMTPIRLSLATFAGVALLLGGTACAGNNTPGTAANPDNANGPAHSSGVGPGGHAPISNQAAGVHPTGAGPAGSQ